MASTKLPTCITLSITVRLNSLLGIHLDIENLKVIKNNATWQNFYQYFDPTLYKEFHNTIYMQEFMFVMVARV